MPHLIVSLHARYADLVLVGQSGGEGETIDVGPALAEDVVMTCGRPVLTLPFAGHFPSIGKRPLVAWNGTREATRAVHDAMTILAKADLVTVLSVTEPNPDHLPGAEICTHLARHGVKAESRHSVAGELGVGDVLLNAVADYGADLLVMGAYGHSRLRELVLGGPSRHLLNVMTCPVLMSH
ncbi:MAG: universal stress protein [Alphaproteobacteria bacterium]|nr:universal stress protein [Alphaproteobacteria bacterium]